MAKGLRVPTFVTILCLTIASVVVFGPAATKAVGSLVGQVRCTLSTACDGGKNASTGPGVQGDSAKGNGVVGGTTFVATSMAHTEGVRGIDNSTTGAGNVGVEGISSLAPGISGFENTGAFSAVQGVDLSTTAAGAGVGGFDNNVTGTNLTTGTGVFGLGGVGGAFVGQDSMAHALELDQMSTGFLLRAFTIAGTTTTEETSLDSMGNFVTKGSVTAHGTPHFVSRTSGGADVVAYGARQTEPTMEDFGEARLTNGQGFVRMDAAFAAAIDRSSNYLVFITPKGDSRGLYVSQQSSGGFVVRENQNGHSTLLFDYRIVAKPFDSNERRMPLVSQREALTDTGHVRFIRPYSHD